MSTVRRLGVVTALALSLLALAPAHSFSQEAGRPEAGRDPRRGVESDEQRRVDENRRDERRANAAEVVGRRTGLTTRQNSEFHDANTLDGGIKARHEETDEGWRAEDQRRTDERHTDDRRNGGTNEVGSAGDAARLNAEIKTQK